MFNYRTVTSRPFFHPIRHPLIPLSRIPSFASTGTTGVTAPNSHPGSIGVTAPTSVTGIIATNLLTAPNRSALSFPTGFTYPFCPENIPQIHTNPQKIVTLFNNMQKMFCCIEKIYYTCSVNFKIYISWTLLIFQIVM